jgi:hypothetical protein
VWERRGWTLPEKQNPEAADAANLSWEEVEVTLFLVFLLTPAW